ncbi:D-Ala-D-Ala carboxypeptidase family metallohydrolase [Ancylobacter sp. FA202]|uniref:D-Ala-D-Ala carboxypeptidase family metallohydrolase n=1 Tax=Ancylobacter sp. FA202 TaxID=1111106 RepID=UPI000379CCE1|nr:D-Ala-D-Ala carboxypeptidase family metallohydrolase [Ancylobacter sp. FA202]
MDIVLTDTDADALARTATSEVGHFGRYGAATLQGGVTAVVDTILNRVAHAGFPDTVGAVVDARYQFSAIGGPKGVGSWTRLRPAGPVISGLVKAHLAARAGGAPCTVKGAGHFLNPHYSSAKALASWGNHVVHNAVAVWGQGKDIHYHGFAPGSKPPADYTLSYMGGHASFIGAGTPVGAPAPVNVPPVAPPVSPSTLDSLAERGETPPTRSFRVEQVPADDPAGLEAMLNLIRAEGGEILHILPADTRILLVADMPAEAGPDEVDDVDADGLATPIPAGAPPVAAPGETHPFARFLQGKEVVLTHFRPEEFLVLGGQNASGACAGRNHAPPPDLWANIIPTARVLDALRQRLDAPIRIVSAYRAPDYNQCLPGAASASYHMQFRAVDFVCSDERGPVHWARELRAMRNEGLFAGGIGVYPTFVHVDTRGQNRHFGPWADRVF